MFLIDGLLVMTSEGYFKSVVVNFQRRQSFDGIALDIVGRKVYYADAGYGRIGELSMNGTGHRIIINDINMKPRGIVYDQQNRFAIDLFISLYCKPINGKPENAETRHHPSARLL
jgi:hypothetical protein